jgi:prepilin-type N-terminal cleavage/methylation domain-containing protein
MPACPPAKPTRAFTLIELIAVVVVIGLLVALGAFGYTSFVNRSRDQAVVTQLRQIATSVSAP